MTQRRQTQPCSWGRAGRLFSGAIWVKAGELGAGRALSDLPALLQPGGIGNVAQGRQLNSFLIATSTSLTGSSSLTCLCYGTLSTQST